MARSFTAAQMLARVREGADCENDTHVTDAEIYKKLTAAVANTWGKLLRAGLGGEGVKWATFTTVANQQEYSLTGSIWAINGGAASALTDFWQVKTLYSVEPDGHFRPIKRVSPHEQHGMRAPLGAHAMKLYYIPCAPTFSTGSETFDGINGWEEHAIQGAIVAIKAKKQDDASLAKQAMREIEEDIKSQANRNQDEAPAIVRRQKAARTAAYWAPYTTNVTGWDIRGNNIELFYANGTYNF